MTTRLVCGLVRVSISRNGFNFVFFFNDTATTEIYTLSLHDALPICGPALALHGELEVIALPHATELIDFIVVPRDKRSEEHTSELQSQSNLVCRLLLEKKHRPARQGDRAKTLELRCISVWICNESSA